MNERLHSATLPAALTRFMRLLRSKGARCGVQEERESLEILADGLLLSPEVFRGILRSIVPKNFQELRWFDEEFEGFWYNVSPETITTNKPPSTTAPPQKSSAAPPQVGSAKAQQCTTIADWLGIHSTPEENKQNNTPMPGYSPHNGSGKNDIPTMNEEEVEELHRIIAVIARSLQQEQTRRLLPGKKGRELEMRRTMRASVRTGGELFFLKYQKPKLRRKKLLLFCDVSKSMDVYSVFFIRWMIFFQRVYRRMETFCFSTSLYRITDVLHHEDIENIVGELSNSVPGWSGGTRIGASLQEFLVSYRDYQPDRRTLVIIMSDGWDTGDTGVLAEVMQTLKRKSAGVIWLNPLAGRESFEPLCAGLQAALPNVDVHAPLHDLTTLRNFLQLLRKNNGFRSISKRL